jgi:hypothetical protein
MESGSWRVGGASGRPIIGARIVSAAGVQTVGAIKSTPDDHFTAGPDCRVILSAGGCVGGAGDYPTIRTRIVSPTGVEIVGIAIATPDDHFIAGPYCRV